jgi:hypothetical protein
MPEPSADDRPCRTCGRPRGPNIAEGTRCARCGQRHALILWAGAAFAAGEWSLFYSGRLTDALVAGTTTLVGFVPAFVGAVLVRELCHAAVARCLGATVTRVLVGEGHALARIGRDPELVFGSVLLGNGLTTAMDLRLDAYRTRMTAILLSAPILSLAVGAIAWTMSEDWALPIRVAARLFALGNLALGLITLVPVPTFRGRIWSDLAAARYLWHATDAEVVEHMLLSAQDRLAILVDRRENAAAVATARAALSVAPEAPLAHSLLAFTLLQTGQTDEAGRVARAALDGMIDDESRAYLTRLADEAERSANSGHQHE